MNHLYNKIKKEANIKIYDKKCLLAKINNLYLLSEKLDDLDTINVIYKITSDCAENSLCIKLKKMFGDFILDLQKKAKFFHICRI